MFFFFWLKNAISVSVIYIDLVSFTRILIYEYDIYHLLMSAFSKLRCPDSKYLVRFKIYLDILKLNFALLELTLLNLKANYSF